jgi:hypothetical protein
MFLKRSSSEIRRGAKLGFDVPSGSTKTSSAAVIVINPIRSVRQVCCSASRWCNATGSVDPLISLNSIRKKRCLKIL